MNRIILSLLLWIACSSSGLGQVIAGPMLGAVHLRDAKIWFQFSPGKQQLVYWSNQAPEIRFTQMLLPEESNGNTAIACLSDLQPGTAYTYHIAAEPERTWNFTTQPLWQWRTQAPDFRLALGSCAYINDEPQDRPGKPYGGDYGIFSSIALADPDVMIWLGDHVYFREGDWDSRAGMVRRYIHTRSTPELQTLLPACAHLAVWDDHDFGPNDGTGNFILKNEALDVFDTFWANPTTGVPSVEGGRGITTRYSYSDVDFFLLDNRYHRVAHFVKGVAPTLLGEEQINWLIQSLKESRAPFKLVAIGGQVLNPVARFENYANYAEERSRLLKLIGENNIRGVIFLSGDRHCTELSTMEITESVRVYDLTSSPLTSSPYDNTKEENTLRVPGTLAAERNFCTIDFKGGKEERRAVLSCFNAAGKLLWEHTIQAPGRP